MLTSFSSYVSRSLYPYGTNLSPEAPKTNPLALLLGNNGALEYQGYFIGTSIDMSLPSLIKVAPFKASATLSPGVQSYNLCCSRRA